MRMKGVLQVEGLAVQTAKTRAKLQCAIAIGARQLHLALAALTQEVRLCPSEIDRLMISGANDD